MKDNKKNKLFAAQALIDEAWECLYAKDRIYLAQQALLLSTDCADAYYILADNCKNTKDKIDFYQMTMEASQRDLGSAFFRENKGHFWGWHEARPFMRAKHGLALILWKVGNKEEAIIYVTDGMKAWHWKRCKERPLQHRKILLRQK